MADYHPLIARAVAGLDKNTGENRRALYERARTALVAQLRGVQPPLDEAEITRERLALEEAIRKIEAESARQAREAQRPPPPKRPEPPRREEPVQAEPPLAREPPPPRPAERPRPETSLSDEAMKGFRDVVGEPTPPAPVARSQEAPVFPPPASRPSEQQPSSRDSDRSESGAEPRPDSRPEPRSDPRGPRENLWALPLESPAPPLPPPAAPVDFDERPAVRSRPRPQGPPSPVVEPMPARSYGGLIRIAIVLAVIAGLGGLAWWQRDAIGGAASSLMATMRGTSTPLPVDVAQPARPKITDRVGQPGVAPQPGSTAAVAQRVVLYEEDPDDPQGKRLVGSAIWRTEMLPAAPGRPSELAVRADVDIPDRKMTMTWSLHRNSDPALPASHTIEIMFNLPPDTPSGGVQNVPGVLMKQAEQTRGVPLAGLAVKVTPGFFLIGLSSLESDMQRNIGLLKERSWFDVPIVYNNNRRAILAMEKGTPGERVFNEAFAAWQQ